MNKIKRSDIDFSILYEEKMGFNKFFIDKNRNIVYKFLTSTPKEDIKNVEKKLENFSILDKGYITKIIDLIYEDDNLVAYSQEIINGDSMHKTLTTKGLLESMKCLIELSKNIEDMHQNGILIGDMHFSNVIVNEKGKPIFIDQDSFGINGIENNGISTILIKYYERKGKDVIVDDNSDRIGFYLSMFDRVFTGREIYGISNEVYVNSIYSLPVLGELYEIYHDLSNRNCRVPKVPYLHQVLKNYDNK